MRAKYIYNDSSKLDFSLKCPRFGTIIFLTIHGLILTMLLISKFFKFKDKQSWLQEQEIFKLPHMDQANVLQFIGVEKRGNNLQTEFWLITAYHERGSLCDFLKAHTLSWTELCRVIETMARGTETIISHSIFIY